MNSPNRIVVSICVQECGFAIAFFAPRENAGRPICVIYLLPETSGLFAPPIHVTFDPADSTTGEPTFALLALDHPTPPQRS